MLERPLRAIRAVEGGESLFRGRRGDSRAVFERGKGEGDRPLEVEELEGEEDDDNEEEEEVPMERRRLWEERGRLRVLRSGLERVGLVGDGFCVVLLRGFLEVAEGFTKGLREGNGYIAAMGPGGEGLRMGA